MGFSSWQKKVSRGLKVGAWSVAALMAMSTLAQAAEQLISNNYQRNLTGEQDINLLQDLRLDQQRSGGMINSVIVVASTAWGMGQLQVIVNGEAISGQQVGQSLQAIQIPVRRELRRDVQDIRIHTRGNFTISMLGITLDDMYAPAPVPGPAPRPPYPPTPNPMPPAPVPYPGVSHIILGNMRNISFNFQARDLQEVFDQCSSFYKSNRIGTIDEVNVSVDASSMQRMYNASSYWKTSTEACLQVVSVARAHGMQNNNRSAYSLLASIQGNWEMNLQGYSRNDILQQCMQQYNSLGIGGSAVDTISYSVNLGEMRGLYNSASYWRDSASLCIAITNGI